MIRFVWLPSLLWILMSASALQHYCFQVRDQAQR